MHISVDLLTTSRARTNDKLSTLRWLERRKGGGGHSSESSGHSSSDSDEDSESGSTSTPKGESPAFSNSASSHSFSLPSESGSAEAYASGGGAKFTLGSDSPFSGRQAGGGDRDQVYGTSRYGSGYPYGVTGSYITTRPFPYVFYPIPITAYDYYGSYPYTSINDTERPGGALMEAVIQSSNNTDATTYRIVGDNSSVAAVFTALVANCSVANSSSAITSFTASSTNYPLPEQVIQWYRASTFALSLDTYNNSASLLSNMPSSDSESALPLSADSPLPAGLNMTFLTCLNTTIGASVPLLVPPTGHHLTAIDIISIVASGISALLSLLLILLWLFSCCCGRRPKKHETRVRSSIVGVASFAPSTT